MTSLRRLPEIGARDESPGTGLLTCHRGNLPLAAMSVDADITGLLAAMAIRQTFRNPHDCPIEATYIFPLPDRSAVTDFSVTISNRRIVGLLQERQVARDAYDNALAAGQRAALLEEDRPDVFTTRIGNLAPGEEATVELTLAGPVPCELGEATFRVPLVVAPRYIPGTPLDGSSAGQGTALDTDAVPDASRITPPVLLPGSPNPVQLAVTVRLDPAGIPMSELRSNLHAVIMAELPGPVTVVLRPGRRLDRDFILRYRTAGDGGSHVTAVAIPDRGPEGGGEQGTYIITVLPPTGVRTAPARDVVLVLDRSGSMAGWKMAAARRAAARIIDSLTSVDRFAILAFDHEVERPNQLPGDTLVEASDRNRYHAVEWLGHLEARGGTEMAAALRSTHELIAGSGGLHRTRSCIVVTDGQVGDEDQLVRLATDAGFRIFTIGIDQAVNAGLLRRLAAVTGGRSDLVESEDRLDQVLADLQRRIGHPVLESVTVRFDALAADTGTATPSRPADLYPGVPLVLSGRFRGRPGGLAIVSSQDGTTMYCQVVAGASPAAAPVWARAHLRDLEDRYAALANSAAGDAETLAAKIVALSLRHRVLCRFTAWVAVDRAGEVVEGPLHRIVQPVELPVGWSPASGASPVAAQMGPSVGGWSAVTSPPVPYQSSPPSGSRPRIRMAEPDNGTRSRKRRAALPEPEMAKGTTTVSLVPYHLRIEELLSAVEQLGGLAAPSAERARLAACARLLAGDLELVTGNVTLVDLLEALAAKLSSGQPAEIQAAATRVREALAENTPRRRARVKPFWR